MRSQGCHTGWGWGVPRKRCRCLEKDRGRMILEDTQFGVTANLWVRLRNRGIGRVAGDRGGLEGWGSQGLGPKDLRDSEEQLRHCHTLKSREGGF